jgi:hypothetical protein
MPNSYKILGQIAPTANTLTNAYSTSSASAVLNSIYICNQDTANANVDIIVRPTGVALANQHYILRQQKLDAADTIILNLNITMNSSTIIAANVAGRSGETKTPNCSISIFGVEIT